jgi:hypothetical protein
MEIAHDWNTTELYEKLCKALNIDTENVNKITIEMEAGKLFTVKIKKWMLIDGYETFVDEIKKYDIKEIK